MPGKRVLGVLAAGLLVGIGLGAPPGQAEPVAAPPPSGPAKTVTLITGDKVRITPSGDSWNVQVEPRRGEPVAFARQLSKEHAYVVPSDAMRLVAKGVLDKRLFDAAGLVEQGYDDASRTSIPLITEGRAAAGAKSVRSLPRSGLTAMAAPKAAAPALWDQLRTSGDRVWLDGKVRTVLDQSVPQVGAPAAWKAGLTGKGVKVAVLDTGYDQRHPDLEGRVASSKVFTGEPSVQDGNGHGTHVASTVAGSGAASGGKYKGVAPDADLLVGKVLTDDGFGQDSWIIAGMEWAAASGADVASMSLGSGYPEDQSGPLAQAVNRISKATKTLFVVAAGNFGEYGPESIGSPGSAEEALTVGSVSKSDVMSSFSSRGPVPGDQRVKPDLVAPGESIVAARAEGTLEDVKVDESYARLDGTSMATPHVAGAAAILVQRHPDWDGTAVKAALTASASPIADAGVYDQGAGRLDVARAFTQQVRTDTATVDLGILRWPHTDGGQGTKDVTYRNDTDAPVTLDLALSAAGENGEPVPAGTVALQSTQLTVPAHGSAATRIDYDLRKAGIGQLGGWLTATHGDVRLRTPVGGFLEPEMYDVKLALTDREGKPARGDRDDIFLQGEEVWTGGADGDVVRVPPGRYVVHGSVLKPSPGKTELALTFIGMPTFEVKANATLRMDARQAKRVTFKVDEPNARVMTSEFHGGVMGERSTSWSLGAGYDEVYLGRQGPAASDYDFGVRARLTAVDATLRVVGPERFQVEVWRDTDSPLIVGRLRAALVNAGRGTPAEIEQLDIAGKVVLVSPEDGDELTEAAAAVRAGGGKALVAWAGPDVGFSGPERRLVPFVSTRRIEGERLAKLSSAREVAVELGGVRNSPYLYDVAFPFDGQPPASTTFRARDRALAKVDARYVNPTAGGAVGGQFASRSEPSVGELYRCCEVVLPARRAEYYSPGEMAFYVDLFGWDDEGQWQGQKVGQSEPVRLRAGRTTQLTWHAPVLGPGFGRLFESDHAVQRTGSSLVVELPMLADGAGNVDWPYVDQGQEGDRSSLRVFRDGKLVGTSDLAGVREFDVGTGAAKLRLEADFQRTAPWWRTSTRVQAVWTTRSEGDGVLPVLAVRYHPATDLSGLVRGGGKYRLPVSVTWEKGAPVAKVAKLAVQVSYDDGKTWRKAPLVRDGKQWLAELKHPASGFVSLRAQAEDSDGNKVEQTILRAYQLK